MRSLFLRLLVTMWVTMTLLLGVFAMIHAWTFPRESSRFRTVIARSMTLRAERSLDCVERDKASAPCTQILDPIDDRDLRLSVYKDGAVVLGPGVDNPAELIDSAKASPSRSTLLHRRGKNVIAVMLDREGGNRFTVIGIQPSFSPWEIFIAPDTLPYRLLAIVLVSGLVSVVLARYLSRSLRALRHGASRLAHGDLTARVVPTLRGADSEALALGVEMDRMAERIQELLDSQRRLLRDVSHELRSPLARLHLALELVRRKSPEEAMPALDRIEREAERLNQMIGELLTLSRLESGAPLEHRDPIDFVALVRQVVDDAEFEAEQRGARVELRATDEAQTIGNPELLRRAVENVLRNSIRYTEASSAVEVDLSAREDHIELSIRDRGPGVPANALDAIFQPFYRVADDRARYSGGTGLGLAIAAGAVTIHDGTIKATNHPDGGLIVTISLPKSA